VTNEGSCPPDSGSGAKPEHCHPETGVVCPFSGSMHLARNVDAVEHYIDPEACKKHSPQDDSFSSQERG
jgi:hypothetical protein